VPHSGTSTSVGAGFGSVVPVRVGPLVGGRGYPGPPPDVLPVLEPVPPLVLCGAVGPGPPLVEDTSAGCEPDPPGVPVNNVDALPGPDGTVRSSREVRDNRQPA
jgi:hypothetical protein